MLKLTHLIEYLVLYLPPLLGNHSFHVATHVFVLLHSTYIYHRIFFGVSFDPSQYIIDNQYGGEDDYLNYVFPHFCGILISTYFYTILYIIYMKCWLKTQPYLEREVVIPALISGAIWGIADIAWFVAMGN